MPAEKRTASAPPRTRRTGGSSAPNKRPKKSKPAPKKGNFKKLSVLQNKKVDHKHKALKYHDALSRADKALAVPGTQGSFVCLPSVVRQEITTRPNGLTTLIVQWSATQLRATILTDKVISSMESSALTTGSPTSIRPLCCSVRIRNASVMTSMQGLVRILSMPEQLEWGIETDNANVTDAFYNELLAMMQNNSKVKSYTAMDFASTKAFVQAPAAQTAFRQYYPYFQADNVAKRTQALIQGAAAGPINTFIAQFSSTAVANAYDISIHEQFATRFPANTLYSNLAKEGPVASQQDFDMGVAAVQAHSGVPMPVGEAPPMIG